ncbi:YibE/F family protein [Amycolatopsis sp. CA-230715]|uniref:YibE/F family protein n=1 Tax=Amycolatopsis sp. CA-230715 TaxID=2745196 RepID=UPI001C334875|nr:hypothetical protein HUW46_07676 [Amycolatopsis sp. CA-230715]
MDRDEDGTGGTGADDDTGPIRRVPGGGPLPPGGKRRREDRPDLRRTPPPAGKPAERRESGSREPRRRPTGDPVRRPRRAADGPRRETTPAKPKTGVDRKPPASQGKRQPPKKRPPVLDPEIGHGHGHGHTPAAPASRRVRLLLIWLLVPIALLTVAGTLVLYPWGTAAPTSAVPQGTPVHGDITSLANGPCLADGQVQVGDQPPPGGDKPCMTTEVKMTDGAAAGQTLKLVIPVEPSTPRFSLNDSVVLAYNGGDAHDPNSYQLVDFQRGLPLLVLAAIFAVAVIVLGRWQGVAALIALGLSFVVIALFVLPAILAGENPLLVAIAGAGVIMFIALYLTHGLSARTSVAVLGTMVSLALIGGLSAVFSAAASLTGLDDATSTLIGSLGHGIDARGLLLAGVVIGALGVLDDVTVTQTSAVWELRRANPSLSWRELYAAGLRIGRDHVGSAVNTLVMAYAGAALPVLLVSSLSGVGLSAVLGSQDIAQEIVRTLAGSVGIVAAVPVTTVLAALIASREPIPSHTSPIGEQ